ncbi:MAG: ComEC/Rec2 family competence protein, partial [Bacteroidota bacterium]
MKHLNSEWNYNALVALIFILVGSVTLALRSPINNTNHYSHFELGESPELLIKIEKRLKPSLYHHKYYAKVIQLNKREVEGNILVNIAKDSMQNQLLVDDVILTTAKFQDIQKPLNPHQFDYSKYLENHYIIHQIYLELNRSLLVESLPTSIFGYADILRNRINLKLSKSGFNDTSIQMINAILLGQKQDIDQDIYNSYINVGTVHILAVSGLHVGIILGILTWLFKPFIYLKHGRIIRVCLILIFLWMFAIVAGLSPSVTRAVTMFSFVSVGMHLKRETNIFNTLVASAFFILLIKPNFLFEVGFQLSYAAVLSIVCFQPIICSIWKPKIKLVNYLWQIFGVTLAAQLGVAPLSLFYFHQFPGLFFISNLVVVPVLGLILGFGLLVILLSLLKLIPEFVVNAFEWVINLLNNFIAWVAQFESFLFKDIPFDTLQLVLSYLIIISTFWTIHSRQFKWVLAGILGILSLQSYYIYDYYNPSPKKFIVFNKSRHSLIAQQQNKQLLLYHKMNDSILSNQKFLRNYIVGEGIKEWSASFTQRVYMANETAILVIDSLGFYKNLSFKPKTVLLQYSPKINLDRVLQELQPEIVVG